MRIRTQLILAMTLVAGAAAVGVGWSSTRVSSVEFERVVGRDDVRLENEVRQSIADHGQRMGGWREIDDHLHHLGTLCQRRLVLTTGAEVLATGGPGRPLESVNIEADGALVLRLRNPRDGGDQPGPRLVIRGAPSIGVPSPHADLADARVFILDAREPEHATEAHMKFERQINRSILMVILATFALALVAALLIARRITQPLEALTRAVKEMRVGAPPLSIPGVAAGEVADLARAFCEMAERLGQVERLRRRMVNDVAHELRTPMTNLRGQIEAVEDGLLGSSAGTRAMAAELALLERVASDLQDLALLEAGAFDFTMEKVELREILESTVAAFRPRLDELEVSVDMKIDCDAVVEADKTRLSQIFRNLLENAVSHTPRSGMIGVVVGRRDTELEVEIRDSGPGIPAEHLPHVFERFYRVDAARSRRTGGAGLGLAITRHLVAAHGGEIVASSPSGGGAQFTVTLPIRP